MVSKAMVGLRPARGDAACFTAHPGGWHSEAFSSKDNLVQREDFKNRPGLREFHILPSIMIKA